MIECCVLNHLLLRPPSRVNEEKKKRRPKDVFGRTLPTEEEFEVLKNAPKYVCKLFFNLVGLVGVEKSEAGVLPSSLAALFVEIYIT